MSGRPTDPLTSIGVDYGRVGIVAGPLSQWLVNGMAEAGLPVICVETRHMTSLLKAQQISRSKPFHVLRSKVAHCLLLIEFDSQLFR
jgi:hypothetical protein|tara:strand:+ start:30628 stop:30888 length:261 start_codon:yes stop_codon:yes gene_type:complete